MKLPEFGGLRTGRHTRVLPLPGALGMKRFLRFHWWEVRSRCWQAAWLGNQKQTPLPLWLVHRLIHYDKAIVQNKNII